MRYIPVSLILVFSVGCITGPATLAESLSETFSRVSPAVVVVKTRQSELGSLPLSGDGRSYVSVRGLGSGVLVQVEDRVAVFTASHVVQTADDLEVEFADGQTCPARVAASSPTADVALLYLEDPPEKLEPAVLGDSDLVSIGDQVFVVGAPYGLSYTLTVGHVGARRRTQQLLGAMEPMEMFQTDAAINVGNSGGPMFNMKGEVIGIVSLILTRSGGFEGAGFAVTSNLAQRLLVAEGNLWTGMDAYLITGDWAKIFNIPQSAGFLVQRVALLSPAYKMGIRRGEYSARIEERELIVGGDILLSVAGIEIKAENYDRIRTRLREMKDEEILDVSVLRSGKVVELSKKMGQIRMKPGR